MNKKRENDLQRDTNAWEDSQVTASGVVYKSHVETEFEDETEQYVELQVLDTKPPFLDPNIKYTEQKDPVSVVKDPTSDIVKLAQKGSQLVQTMRMEKERSRFGTSSLSVDPKSILGVINGEKGTEDGLTLITFI